jgi:hypothetical protein
MADFRNQESRFETSTMPLQILYIRLMQMFSRSTMPMERIDSDIEPTPEMKDGGRQYSGCRNIEGSPSRYYLDIISN